MDSNLFNEEYYKNCCGSLAYTDSHFMKFFEMIADRIVEDIHPKTVLDAGCAMGYLVAALRDRGVEAWGVDISDYAISNVRDDIKPYCLVGSLTEELPSALPTKFDLVTTIEVIEHMHEEEGKRAIKKLCSLTDKIIFSSSADDYDEYTHYNVQQREYWANIFLENGFYDNLGYRPQYITPWCICFEKGLDLNRQIRDYEHHIRIIENRYNKIEDELRNVKESLNKENDNYVEMKEKYNGIIMSKSWKITAPFRYFWRLLGFESE